MEVTVTNEPYFERHSKTQTGELNRKGVQPDNLGR